MEEREESLKYLQDQIKNLNSQKPKTPKTIDLADYNAYQFTRTLKHFEPVRNEKEGGGKTLLRIQSRDKPRIHTTRDISYRKDIPKKTGDWLGDSQKVTHHDVLRDSGLQSKLKSRSSSTLPMGSASTFAKHRRAESTHAPDVNSLAEPSSYPKDIKHLEKLIKFTGPNHRNVSGGRACNREACINNNALLSPKTQAKNVSEQKTIELLNEENLMHQLEAFYKKNTDFTYSIVKKSALESNMFSHNRVTLEGMMKAKGKKRPGSRVKEDDVFNDIFQSSNSNHRPKHKPVAQKKQVDILSILQDKDISNARKNDLGEPTGRREVELLNQWLDEMLAKYVFSKRNIKHDPEKRKEALYHAKLILSICQRDLIRQVSVQCLERGILIEKVLNNYINIFETETRGNMYDLDELQAKHLKDILKIKAEAARTSHLESRSREIEQSLREKIDGLEEQLEASKNQINRLKEQMKVKEREFNNTILDFKRRQSIAVEQNDKLKRHPLEIEESSESESSIEPFKAGTTKKKRQPLDPKEVIKNKKMVGKNDLLNLPSSEDEGVVRKLKNRHVASSTESEKSSDDGRYGNKLEPRTSTKKISVRAKYKKNHNRIKKRVRTNSFDHGDHSKLDNFDDSKAGRGRSRARKDKLDMTQNKDKTLEHPEETKKKLEDAEYKDLNQRYNEDERDNQYVLNKEEAIEEQINQAEEENNELNESIDKIEEEQDLEFKDKISKIARDMLKQVQEAISDPKKLEKLYETMVAKIFE